MLMKFWRISHIEDGGLIRVIRKRWVGPQTITLGSRCSHVTTKGGFVKGVFGQIAIHLRKERTEMVDVDGLYIDIGVDTKELKQPSVRVGDLVWVTMNQ
jgi:putative aminopeptidase FrvX